jgi:hypothetical protein
MLAHEYTVNGHDRAKVGRWLSILAAAIASVCSILLTELLHLAALLGIATWVPHVLLVPVSAAAVWPLAYWMFNSWAWRLAPVRGYVGIPDLRGDWLVEGETLGGSNYDGPWTGTITVDQCWDKIKVALRTASSGSHSMMAAVVRDPTRGFVLMYTYGNDPKLGQPADMHSHMGYAEIAFDKAQASGEGEYFNNRGRTSFGRMKLTRKVHAHAA